MAAPTDPANLDYAIELYLAGEPLQQIAATAGVSVTRIHRERLARGIPPRKVRQLPDAQIFAAYKAGASELALARQYGVSRNVISKRLTEAGVRRRGPSEAGVARYARMTVQERRTQVAAANRAARLRRSPQIERYRTSLARELRGRHGSTGEAELAIMLQDRGLSSIPQRSIGVYNVDLAILPVAVEVLGGGWHSIKAVHGERSPYILDEGWHLLMVWDYEGRSALGPGAADYIVAFVEQVRRQPPATCQYRVISGDGQLLAARGREDDKFPLVRPPRGR